MIRSVVGFRLKEFIDQISVGTVNLDTVKTSPLRIRGSEPIGFNDSWDFGKVEGPWSDERTNWS